MMKQEWVRPQLVVLSRATPEESVLDLCKSFTTPGPNDHVFDVQCYSRSEGCDCCDLSANS